MSSSYLEVRFLDEDLPRNGKSHDVWRDRILPFANSPVYFSPIEHVEKLSEGDDVKTIYKVGLSLKDVDHEFLPGDTIGVIPLNDQHQIDQLLIRLSAESIADRPFELQISKQTTKKNPTIPKHLPATSTLRDVFLRNVDIQTPPKKQFLKALLNFTTDIEEIAKLEQITSPKGSKEYMELIAGPGKTLLGLLNTFPSCQPPIATILENSFPLQPRSYSISSSPLQKDTLEITFFVVTRDDGRKGLCTGWLENRISRNPSGLVPFYFRQPNNFRLPQDLAIPLILIAAGTGVAPFRGFLQHRLLQANKENGEVWLFFGCRYSDRDYLYKDEMSGYLRNGALTRLDLAFSRDGAEKCYVQHQIEKNGEEFTEWVLSKGAAVFVCGNGKTVVKDVQVAVVNNFVKFGGMSCEDAGSFLSEMKKKNRYVIDNWI